MRDVRDVQTALEESIESLAELHDQVHRLFPTLLFVNLMCVGGADVVPTVFHHRKIVLRDRTECIEAHRWKHVYDLSRYTSGINRHSMERFAGALDNQVC